MRDHCTGFVPVCKRNVRVLSTGTKEEIKGRLPTGVQRGRQDQRMNDLLSPAEPTSAEAAAKAGSGLRGGGWSHAQRAFLRTRQQIHRKDAKKEGDTRSLCAFASLRFIQPSDGPHAQRRQMTPVRLLPPGRPRPDNRPSADCAGAPLPGSNSSDGPHAQRRDGWSQRQTLRWQNSAKQPYAKVAPDPQARALPEPAGDGAVLRPIHDVKDQV